MTEGNNSTRNNLQFHYSNDDRNKINPLCAYMIRAGSILATEECIPYSHRSEKRRTESSVLIGHSHTPMRKDCQKRHDIGV